MFNQSTFWRVFGVVSCFFTFVCLSQSHFFQHQIQNTKSWLAYFILALLMFVACVFLFIPTKIRKINEKIDVHCPGWLVKACFDFCNLLFVTLVAVLSKYPRFKVFHKQDGSISDIRAYCQKSKYPDPDIKAICEGLVEEQNTEQGDFMGFYSAVGFSVFTFSISRQLKLPNEYGIFYMSLDLMMNAAMDIPVSGGSILHWKYVLISIAYCFASIFLRRILLSFGENDGKHLQGEHQAEAMSLRSYDDDDDEEERRRSIEAAEERASVKRARKRRSIEAKERRRNIEEKRSMEAKERRRIIEEERLIEMEEGFL